MKRFNDKRDWFFDKRFGLFIHWGIYSLGGKHEQEQWCCKVPAENYEKYAEKFNPVNFYPSEWIDIAQNKVVSSRGLSRE